MKKLFLLSAISAFMLTSCFYSQNIHAQSSVQKIVKTDKVNESGFFDVKVINFLFKKIDHNKKIIAFTEADAEKLNSFFANESSVIAVESHAIDKSVRVISLLQKDGTSLFKHKEFVEMLSELGYVVTRLHCKTQEQYIASTVSTDESKLVVQVTNDKASECSDCSNVKINKEDLEMFKNMDFGGNVIDFDFGGDSISPFDMD